MRWMLLSLLMLAAITGCAVDQKYSQTELNALQTREFDYPFDATFDATVGVLFDRGYTILTCDKRAGLLSAGNGHNASVQIKLDQAGPRRTSVRISTVYGGQARVDKDKIDEFLNLIDRRLTAGPVRRGQ